MHALDQQTVDKENLYAICGTAVWLGTLILRVFSSYPAGAQSLGV